MVYTAAEASQVAAALQRYQQKAEAAKPLVAPSVYLIGSLRNPKIPSIASALRVEGFEVFDDWFSAGPEADDAWQAHEAARGRTFKEALAGWHAQEVYQFDTKHLSRCGIVVLALPAGKSGHLELGFALGLGKPGYILLDGKPERFDVMYNFATDIFTSVDQMTKSLFHRFVKAL